MTLQLFGWFVLVVIAVVVTGYSFFIVLAIAGFGSTYAPLWFFSAAAITAFSWWLVVYMAPFTVRVTA